MYISKDIYLGEEFFRGTIVSDGFLVSWGDSDSYIAGGVKVILVSEDLARVFHLFAWVPL